MNRIFLWVVVVFVAVIVALLLLALAVQGPRETPTPQPTAFIPTPSVTPSPTPEALTSDQEALVDLEGEASTLVLDEEVDTSTTELGTELQGI